MKKYKALSRVYLLSYLVAIFCAVLFGLLLVKQNLVVAIILMVLAVLDLAALIVSKHVFSKNYQLFFFISVFALGYLNISVIGSFIIELVYTIQGLPAPYAWMIVSISIVFLFLIDFFYIRTIKKIHHKALVDEGIIEEKEEEV